MSTVGVFHFAEAQGPASRLALELGGTAAAINVHRFPDGESLVRVPAPTGVQRALLYCSLDHPNARLVELLLAAAALRENGSKRVALVAPYLGYMRQDIAFQPGEAVSQRVIGALLSQHFDALFTIDPHLHRIASLAEIMPDIEAVSLTAAPALSAAIDASDQPVLIGPDSESLQWVEQIAMPQGLSFLIGAKERYGDRSVTIRLDGVEMVRGRRVILVDDVISSGMTLQVAARQLLEAGASRVEALATHCLASPEDMAALHAAGIAQIRACDSVAGPVATIPTAPLLAMALKESRFLRER